MILLGRLLLAASLIAVCVSTTARADGDVEAGKKIFSKCALCHSPVKGQNKVGPSLWDVVGRPSASLPDYNYSTAMKNAHKVWNPETLNVYLTNPRAMVPGTKMIFPGLPSEQDRKDVIAYLSTLK